MPGFNGTRLTENSGEKLIGLTTIENFSKRDFLG
jgi:hypothetical protein